MMDDERFDRLTRRLAISASRRQVLKGLAAGVGGLLPLAVGGRAAADDDKPKKACEGVPLSTPCGTGRVCCNGRCVKPCKAATGERVDEDCACFGLCCPEGATCNAEHEACDCDPVLGGNPCNGVCCVIDETACFVDPGGREECRPCVLEGPAPPGTPCCRGGSGSSETGFVCTAGA